MCIPFLIPLSDGCFATSIFSESGTGCAIRAASPLDSIAQNPFSVHSYPQILLKTRKKNEEIRKTPDSTRERIIENMKTYGVSKELLIRYYCSTPTRAETLLAKSLAIAVIVFVIGMFVFAIYALNSGS